MLLPVDALRPGGMRLPDGKRADAFRIMRLHDIRRRMGEALDRAEPGPVSRDLLKAAGLTEYDGRFGQWAERTRVYHGKGTGVFRGQLSTVTAAIHMWSAVRHLLRRGGPQQSGRLQLVVDRKTKARALRVTAYAEIHEDFRKPTLLLDACFDAERVRPLFPQVEAIGGAMRIDAPHVTIVKAIGRPFAKYEMEPLKPPKGEELAKLTEKQAQARLKILELENKRRESKRREVKCFVSKLARQYGRTLFIGNKDVVEAMDLLPHIETAHFNNLAGRDAWRDVNCIVICGATTPKPADVEDISACMTGAEPQRSPVVKGKKTWYPSRIARHIVRRGDGFVGVEAEQFRHPDPTAELQLRRICEGELLQALGRGRPIRRTADNPPVVFILNDAVHDFPVDVLVDAGVVSRLTPQDLMLAEGGIAFESATDAAKAYPALWPNAKAAQKAFDRGQEQRDILLNGISSLTKCLSVRVRYQLKGAQTKNQALPNRRISRSRSEGDADGYVGRADFVQDHPARAGRPHRRFGHGHARDDQHAGADAVARRRSYA